MATSWIIVPANMLSLVAHQYQRTVPSLREDVTTLKNWMETQLHLPETLDDKRIENFLLLNKCSVEKTKEKIDNYYTLRARIPDIFDNMDPSCDAIKHTAEIACWIPVPKITEEMHRIWIFKILDKTKAEELDLLHLVSQVNLLQEVRLKEDVMFGDLHIYDLDGLTFSMMSKFSPPVLMKILTVYEKILSFPMKKCFIVNSPPFIELILKLMKNLIKPKLFERIKVCQDTSILREFLPRECIPKDYGGDEKSVQELFEIARIRMGEYQGRFEELLRMKVDEGLRPQKLENDDVLGFHGNFKKLDVD